MQAGAVDSQRKLSQGRQRDLQLSSPKLPQHQLPGRVSATFQTCRLPLMNSAGLMLLSAPVIGDIGVIGVIGVIDDVTISTQKCPEGHMPRGMSPWLCPELRDFGKFT